MAENSNALKIGALVAGGAGLFGAGVALGRGRAGEPDPPEPLSVRDPGVVELQSNGVLFRRERPGVFIVDYDGAKYRIARALTAPEIKVGGFYLERAHWLALTGMLESAWLVLEAVPASRTVEPIRLVVTSLPPRNRSSIFVESPLRIFRESLMGEARYLVLGPDGAEVAFPRRRAEPVTVGDRSLSERDWTITIAVLEAAWSIGEVMGF